jgi:hypothetical protein
VPIVNIKSIVLYNGRAIQPQTLEKILKARDGEMIPVDPQEMNAFLQLTLFMGDVKKLYDKKTATQTGKPDGAVEGGK